MKSINEYWRKLGSAGKSGIINLCLKPISLVLNLVYTPLLLSYLGNEKYGIWATLLSVISWINYFDVGIGNGLRNLLSKEIYNNKREEAKKSVSTAYVVLSVITMIVYLTLLISSLVLNWNRALSTTIDVKPTLIISFTFICLNFVLSLSKTLLYALQKAERVSFIGCISQTINLIGLIALKQFTESSLVWLSIVFGASSTVVFVFESIRIFKSKTYLRPSYSKYDKFKIKEICTVGLQFFVIQIMCLLLFTVDNLLVSHYFGAEAVTPFSIADKVFNTAYSFLASFLVPYWSQSTVAFSKHDYAWVRKSVKNVSKICGLFIIGYIVLVFAFKPLVRIWLGKELVFQPGLVSVMSAFYIIYSILTVECQFINGSGKIKTQLIFYCFAGITNVPLSIFLGIGFNMGPVGIRFATTILVTIEVVILGFDLLKIISDAESEKRQ